MKTLNVFTRKEELSAGLCDSGGRGRPLAGCCSQPPPGPLGRVSLLSSPGKHHTASFIFTRMRPTLESAARAPLSGFGLGAHSLPGSPTVTSQGQPPRSYQTGPRSPLLPWQLCAAVQLQSGSRRTLRVLPGSRAHTPSQAQLHSVTAPSPVSAALSAWLMPNPTAFPAVRMLGVSLKPHEATPVPCRRQMHLGGPCSLSRG